jgi:membrane protein
VVWAVASLAFGLYVSGFSNYEKTYGALAGVIIFLLWLWITNLALLFGAEFDSELERSRELQAGMPAADELQLPPRDTRRIEKKQEQDQQARARAEQLRDSSGRDGGARDDQHTVDVRDERARRVD